VPCPRSVEGSRQQGEVRRGEFLSPAEQAHGDKGISIGKKRTPEFRHRDRIRHGGDDGHGKDADRETGGPRYLLPLATTSAPGNIDLTFICAWRHLRAVFRRLLCFKRQINEGKLTG